MNDLKTTQEMYVGESFAVWVIRRGWHFWTGTKWELAPYTAKLFSQEKDARQYIARRHLDRDSDQWGPDDRASVRRCTLKHH